MQQPSYLAAIPVFNEQQYLPAMLSAVRQYSQHILVVNDGSTDRTGEILAARDDVEVIHHPINQGYGQCMIDTFDFARRHGYEWIITLDCDGQHEPCMIPAFEKAAETLGADVVSGSRYLRHLAGNSKPPSDRRAINMTITRRINERLGLAITDAFCGFKAYRAKAVSRLNLTVPGYAFPMQFWVQAYSAGLKIAELPVRLIYPDPARRFGGPLDDSSARLEYYLKTFETELAAVDGAKPQTAANETAA